MCFAWHYHGVINSSFGLSFWICTGGVWIVGDSLIRWAQRSLPVGVPVLWRGRGGARLSDLWALLSSMPKNSPPPAVLIIHLGTNYLIAMDVYSVRQSIAIFMEWVRAQFPHTLVFWSEILPRVFYFGAHSQKSMEQQRKKINRWMRTCCQRNRCMILRHPQFIWSDLSLYRFDGVHLSEAGNAVFCDNFTDCINNL